MSENVQRRRVLRLSSSQVKVLELVAQGYFSSDIAEELGIAVASVENYRKSILQRTDSLNITQACLKAIHAGLIKMSDLDL